MSHPTLTRINGYANRTRNLREAQDGITNVRILHLKDVRGRCNHCNTPWPCPTWEATETEWERTRRALEGQVQVTRQRTVALVEQFAVAEAERVDALQRSIDAAQRGHDTVAALLYLNPSWGLVADLLDMDEATVRWHLDQAESGRVLGHAGNAVAQ